MDINLEALEQIPKLVAQINELIFLQKEGSIEKKWLNVEEVVFYLGYSKNKVYKLVKDEWTEGLHYHKPTGRLIFSKEKLDNWVTGTNEMDTKRIIDDIGLIYNYKVNNFCILSHF